MELGFVYAAMSDDDQSGPFQKRVGDDDLVAFVKEHEVVTTKEVADHFGYHIQTARRRLKTLEQEDRLKGKDVSKRFVWWVSDV